jgi:hypothetical protein
MPDQLRARHRCGTGSRLEVDASGKLEHARPIVTVELTKRCVGVGSRWTEFGRCIHIVEFRGVQRVIRLQTKLDSELRLEHEVFEDLCLCSRQ